MKTYQTLGIVIGRTNFGEADRIIRVLTSEHGKISAIAKGVRRIKSRSGGHLELFGEVNLMLAPGRGSLDTVASARLNWYPHQLATDYNRLKLAYLMATITDQVAGERHPQPELYAHLLDALKAVDLGASGELAELWFKLRILALTGLRPELTRCLACGSASPDTQFYFDAGRGGIVCAADSGALTKSISVEAIKLWRILCDYPFATVSQINGAAALAGQTLALADEFYEHHLGKAFHV